MSTLTTNISLTKPAVGETGWGTAINGNFDTIDSEINTIKVTTIPLKANISGPTFTGVPAAPTAIAGTNTTQIATTAFTKTAVDTMGGTKAATSHTHAESEITNLTSDLSGKAASSHTHSYAPATHSWIKLTASNTLKASYDTETTHSYAYNAVALKYVATINLPPNITIGSVVRISVDIKTSESPYPAYCYCVDSWHEVAGNNNTSGYGFPNAYLMRASTTSITYETISTDVTINAARQLIFAIHPYAGNPSSRSAWVRNIRVYCDETATAPGWS